MDYRSIEQKWQARWEKDKIYDFKRDSDKPKYYVLEMFSYPSGAKLHAGHWFNYGPSDSFAQAAALQVAVNPDSAQLQNKGKQGA